jgi:glycosyltransferase involved in cell wall biosynthesis
MSKLSIVFPVLNQIPLSRTAIGLARANLSAGSNAEIIIIDNGSDTPFAPQVLPAEQEIVIRHEDTIGVYPTFWDALTVATGDIIAYLHSDLIVAEKDWDKRVLKAFEDDSKLGMIGFIGSSEIDFAGGRGYKTTSNFQGGSYYDNDGLGHVKDWQGSPAHVHGFTNAGFTYAAVVDGCAMVFRRSVLESIPQRPDFPPHHFYDRLLSCEVRERGYKVGVLGIACDHISGQTVCNELQYHYFAKRWCEEHGVPIPEGNHDTALYKEAERQFLKEYRDEKPFVPSHV